MISSPINSFAIKADLNESAFYFLNTYRQQQLIHAKGNNPDGIVKYEKVRITVLPILVVQEQFIYFNPKIIGFTVFIKLTVYLDFKIINVLYNISFNYEGRIR